jgi:hypothetical protein
MTQKTRIFIIVTIFLILLCAWNIIFVLKLVAGTDGMISSWQMIVVIIEMILVPLVLYAGFLYIPKERRTRIFAMIMVAAILVQTIIRPRSLVSVSAVVIAFIVAICIAIVWTNRDGRQEYTR